MKLKNKRSGEIKEFVLFDDKNELQGGATLKDLVEEWEDYEEPKGIKSVGNIGSSVHIEFETREEAERAVEKLKSWKRLKDKGFRFEKWCTWEKVTGLACFDKGVAHSYYAGFTFRSEDRLEKDEQMKADLDLLFGGEE